MVRFFRWLLFPFSILYALVVRFRNWAYDSGLFKSTSFNLPVVVIGNLSVGGTGKSPMTEYVLQLMKPYLNVAILSRGYGRKTVGFRYVETDDTAKLVGDEPLQIKRKFPDSMVTVCEDRVWAIHNIQDEVDAVLLDDAYQHRKLKPRFSILLLDYESMQHPILPLPTGNFREPLSGSKRADVVVVTKCPDELPVPIKSMLSERLRKYSSAPIFYTKIHYQQLQRVDGSLLENKTGVDRIALVVTGIAKPQPLLDYLQPQFKEIIHLAYRDHHSFSPTDLQKISQTFAHIDTSEKIIITTEKDMQRLPPSFVEKHPLYFLPIEQVFLYDQAPAFDRIVKRAFAC